MLFFLREVEQEREDFSTCYGATLLHFLWRAQHGGRHAALLAEARRVPSGAQATPSTGHAWRSSKRSSLPPAASHRSTVLSFPAEARRALSGAQATPRTLSVWPWQVASKAPSGGRAGARASGIILASFYFYERHILLDA